MAVTSVPMETVKARYRILEWVVPLRQGRWWLVPAVRIAFAAGVVRTAGRTPPTAYLMEGRYDARCGRASELLW
jgi:hypothetical protein